VEKIGKFEWVVFEAVWFGGMGCGE